MAKYFLALIGILCLLPMAALAAHDTVTFAQDTDLYLTGSGITIIAKSNGEVAGIEVHPTYIVVDLMDGSLITLVSNDRKTLSAVAAIATTECATNLSQIVLSSTSTQSITVTPGDTCIMQGVSGIGGGAPGGGGGAPAPTPAVTVPITAMTVQELKAEVARITTLILQLQAELAKLIGAPQSFATNLFYGLQSNADVKRLQEFLISKGYLSSGLNTGNYLSLTMEAVKAYQTAKGITPVSGYFGPKTRAAVSADIGATQ